VSRALPLVAVLLAGCASAAPERAAAPPGGWQRVEPGGKTRCARGGPYAFWLRRGDPKRLVIFFQGGGGCFDARTCAVGSTWFDDRVDGGDDPAYSRGILDLDDARNPFRGWSFVYVPSCTGDVHTGDARVRYGSVVVEQRGWQNARAALRRTYREFRDPDVVLVTGCSAGSVGSAWHAGAVIDRYRGARVAQVGDSLAFLFHRPIRLTDWGTNKHFPSFFRVGNRRWTMEEFVRRLARGHPRATFARFNHAADFVQERFYSAVGGDPAGFPARLRAVERRLKRLPNYRSYLACGTNHCAFQGEEFFSLRVGGVRLRDWVADLAAGRNASCPTCRG
jgi:hypothetical protein